MYISFLWCNAKLLGFPSQASIWGSLKTAHELSYRLLDRTITTWMTAVILELYMRKFLSFSRAEFIRSAGNTRIERKEKKRKRNRKGFTIMLKNKSLCLISKSKKWLSFNVILVLTITGAVLQVTCNYSNIAIQRFAVVVVVCLFCFVLMLSWGIFQGFSRKGDSNADTTIQNSDRARKEKRSLGLQWNSHQLAVKVPNTELTQGFFHITI